MMTREQQVREVARMMREADAVDPTGGRSREEWAAVNAGGWTVDTPSPLDHHLREEGVVLGAAEFDRAFALAQRAE